MTERLEGTYKFAQFCKQAIHYLYENHKQTLIQSISSKALVATPMPYPPRG